MAEIKERRRNYFIKKRFQANFILKFCLLVITGAVASGAIIYLMSGSTVTTTFDNCRLTIKSTADFILPAVLLSGAIVIGFIGLATVAMTLFTSHRIAGPLYRLEKDLQEVTAGNLKKRFNLRRSDEIKALAESLNELTSSLDAKITEIKNKFWELEAALGKIARLPEEARKKLQDLKDALERLKS